MDAKTIFTFAGGVVIGLILGIVFVPGGSQQVGKVSPTSPQQAPQANKLQLQRDIAQLEGIVKNDPQNYQAWKRLGDNYFDVDLPNKSIDSYRKALALDDSDPNVWTDMGVMYRRTGDFTKALEAFEEAIQRGPNHTISRLNKGVVYIYDLQDTAKGIAAWEDFLRLQPTGPQADQVRADIARLQGTTAAPGGPLPPGAELPPDHPPLEGGDEIPAPAPGGGEDPSGYFPKPEQQ